MLPSVRISSGVLINAGATLRAVNAHACRLRERGSVRLARHRDALDH
jgi:hypothetical protein